MGINCCVKGCETFAKNGMHSFPSNKFAAERWITATKTFHLITRLNTNKLSHSYYKVCKKHFLTTDLMLNGKGQTVVKPDSIPSLFLPNDADIKVPQRSSSRSEKLVKRLQHQNSVSNGHDTKQLEENDLVDLERDTHVDVEILSSEEEIEVPMSSSSVKVPKTASRITKVTVRGCSV